MQNNNKLSNLMQSQILEDDALRENKPVDPTISSYE